MRVTVDAQGRAERTEVLESSGHASLDRAAEAAVRTWRYRPAERDGHAVGGRIDVPIVFRLQD